MLTAAMAKLKLQQTKHVETVETCTGNGIKQRQKNTNGSNVVAANKHTHAYLKATFCTQQHHKDNN
jgi:hypothetical protein